MRKREGGMGREASGGLNRRRLLRGGVLAAAGLAGASVVDALAIEPHWPKVEEVSVTLPTWPGAFDGLRIGHISDLHCGEDVSVDYLRRCMGKLQALGPDLVVATGDYIVDTGKTADAQAVVDLLAELAAPLGVFAVLGNHDYGSYGPGRAHARSMAAFQKKAFGDSPTTLLCDTCQPLTRDGASVWIAGLEDIWATNGSPRKVLADVPGGAACVSLVHNPDAAESLAKAGADLILAGHTHGGQVRVPLVGAPVLPVRRREFDRGLHAVGDAWLYVNCGLGSLYGIRFCCRPEITLLTVRGNGY